MVLKSNRSDLLWFQKAIDQAYYGSKRQQIRLIMVIKSNRSDLLWF